MAKKKKDSLIVHEGEALEGIYESLGPRSKIVFNIICIGCAIFCLVRTIKFIIMLFTGGSE